MDLRHPYRYEEFLEVYSDSFEKQLGKGFRVYGGRSVVPVRGMSGAGFGSVLVKLACKTLPYTKVVGKRLLTHAAGLVGNLLSGEDFATSAKRRLATAGRELVSDFATRKKRIKIYGQSQKKP